MKFWGKVKAKLADCNNYRNWKIGILAAIVIYLLVSVFSYINQINSLMQVSLDKDDFINIEDDAGQGIYEVSEPFFLRKGSYTYEVEYSSNGASGSFLWPFAVVDYYNAFEQATVWLNDGDCSGGNSFNLNVNLDMNLRLYYSGTGDVVVKSLSLSETTEYATRELVKHILLCIVIIAILALYEYRRKYPSKDGVGLVLTTLALITLLASFPIISSSSPNGNDFGFHMTRIQGIAEGLLSGQFPVRINPTFYCGYGYADPEYYGNTLLYIPALLYMCGFGLTESYNIFLVVLNALTAILTYYAFSKMTKDNVIALCGAFLYTLAPYRIMCIYYRAAVGEFSAMAFFPLILYGLWRIFSDDTEDEKYSYAHIPLVIGLSGIIQSHILSCEMVGGVILLTCVLLFKRVFRKRTFIQLVSAVAGTVLLNLWFLVPFVDSWLNQTVKISVVGTDINSIQKTGLYFTQLFTVFPTFSLITTEAGAVLDITAYRDEMPLILGIVFLVGALISLGAISLNVADKKMKKVGIVTLGLAVITTWMATIYFPWDKICDMSPLFRKLITSLQFSWRWLGAASLLMACASVIGIKILDEKNAYLGKTLAIALCVMALVTPVSLMENTIKNQTYTFLDDISDIGYNTACTVSKGEYSLIDSSWDIVNSVYEPTLFNGVEISNYAKNGTTITFNVDDSGKDGYVYLPLLAYRGYSASGENSSINKSLISEGDYRVLKVSIPEGYTGEIKIYFAGFWYWRVAEIVSLIALVATIILLHRERKNLSFYPFKSRK